MTTKRFTYFFLRTLPLLLAGGCADELLTPDENAAGDPNVVKFSATVGRAFDVASRSAEIPLYEPLVLTSEAGGAPLYLHTFETDKVGFRPGEDSGLNTRGMQVESVSQLEEYHKDFMVHASIKNEGSEYIEWTRTHASAKGSDIWLTDITRYWPGDTELAFHAVSPSTEWGNLVKPSFTTNNMSFSYTAKKGTADNDAQAQTDLLVATSSCNKAGSVNGRAPLQFHHALSSIKFAVRDVLDGEVVNIKISGVKSSGNCTYSTSDAGTDGVFTWSEQSGKETYSQNFNYTIDGRPVVDPSDESKDLLLNDKMPEKTFMLIPQQIPSDAEIIVTIKQKGLNGGAEKVLRAKIRDNAVSEWKAGHEYIYTISTSKDNWVYVLNATGNHDTETNTHNVDGNQIYVYSPSKYEHDTYKDNAYFKVVSYRYRANNQNYIEDLPWKATHGDAKQYRVPAGVAEIYVPNRDVKASDWITDPKGLQGNGSHTKDGERHDISMLEHHILTNWQGDVDMQDFAPYTGNSEEKPWDLSTCGSNNLPRTTANCYVIDREGWYCFPLYYGNAMVDGKDNPGAYKYNNVACFPTYNPSVNITGYEIPSTLCGSAEIVWSDVYNAISDVKIETIGGVRMIKFKANKYNLQQGNVVIALSDDKGDIVWSWHIWINEHWLAPGVDKGYSHAQKPDATDFGYTPSPSNRRQRGDVVVNVNDGEVNVSRFMAPYNLGWCDPKNVDYLRRPSTMEYVQYQKDGVTPTTKKCSLPIVQDGERIEYKYANTTYYQFGRKDPSIGFVNHDNDVKRCFGDKPFKKMPQTQSMSYAIQHPNELFCTGTADNWCSNPSDNMWNNGNNSNPGRQTSNYTVKTVYDPCPPGYCVPPAVILRFIGKSTRYKDYKGVWHDPTYFCSESLDVGTYPNVFEHFNGVQESQFLFRIKRKADLSDNFANEDAIWISSTGNRWYTDSRPTVAMGGDNFNWQLAYLWSCTVHTGAATMAYGIALGQDNNYVESGKDDSEIDKNGRKYVITPYFDGRRSMARPVRPVREKLP